MQLFGLPWSSADVGKMFALVDTELLSILALIKSTLHIEPSLNKWLLLWIDRCKNSNLPFKTLRIAMFSAWNDKIKNNCNNYDCCNLPVRMSLSVLPDFLLCFLRFLRHELALITIKTRVNNTERTANTPITSNNCWLTSGVSSFAVQFYFYFFEKKN